MRWLVLVLGAVGCSSGGEGADSAAQAPVCEAQWADAEGQPVPGAVQLPEGLGFIDGAGNVWRLDATGAGEPLYPWTGLEILYADEGCTEAYYRAALPARYVAERDGQTFALPDGAEPVQLENAHTIGEPGCYLVGSVQAVPVADLVSVSTPAVPWTTPLHPELP